MKMGEIEIEGKQGGKVSRQHGGQQKRKEVGWGDGPKQVKD